MSFLKCFRSFYHNHSPECLKNNEVNIGQEFNKGTIVCVSVQRIWSYTTKSIISILHFTRYGDGMLYEVTPITIWYIHPPHHGQPEVTAMVGMIDLLTFHSVWIGPPIPAMRLFHTLTLNIQGQCHLCSKRTRSQTKPSIQLVCYLFV